MGFAELVSFTKPKTSEPPEAGKSVRVTIGGTKRFRQEDRALVYPACISPALMIYVTPGSVVNQLCEMRFMYADEVQELHGVAKKITRFTKMPIVVCF